MKYLIFIFISIFLVTCNSQTAFRASQYQNLTYNTKIVHFINFDSNENTTIGDLKSCRSKNLNNVLTEKNENLCKIELTHSFKEVIYKLCYNSIQGLYIENSDVLGEGFISETISYLVIQSNIKAENKTNENAVFLILKEIGAIKSVVKIKSLYSDEFHLNEMNVDNLGNDIFKLNIYDVSFPKQRTLHTIALFKITSESHIEVIEELKAKEILKNQN